MVTGLLAIFWAGYLFYSGKAGLERLNFLFNFELKVTSINYKPLSTQTPPTWAPFSGLSTIGPHCSSLKVLWPHELLVLPWGVLCPPHLVPSHMLFHLPFLSPWPPQGVLSTCGLCLDSLCECLSVKTPSKALPVPRELCNVSTLESPP